MYIGKLQKLRVSADDFPHFNFIALQTANFIFDFFSEESYVNTIITIILSSFFYYYYCYFFVIIITFIINATTNLIASHYPFRETAVCLVIFYPSFNTVSLEEMVLLKYGLYNVFSWKYLWNGHFPRKLIWKINDFNPFLHILSGLGDGCTLPSDCSAVAYSACKNNVCTCVEGYTQSNNECTLASSGGKEVWVLN